MSKSVTAQDGLPFENSLNSVVTVSRLRQAGIHAHSEDGELPGAWRGGAPH